MNSEINCQQIAALSPAYVLRQLDAAESERVSVHLARCTACRRLVAADRRLGMAVRQTLEAATAYERPQLERLMPAAWPNRRVRESLWRQPLAAACLFALLLLGGLSLQPGRMPTMGTDLTATATLTPTATSTLTPTRQQVAMAGPWAAGSPGRAAVAPAFTPAAESPAPARTASPPEAHRR